MAVGILNLAFNSYTVYPIMFLLSVGAEFNSYIILPVIAVQACLEIWVAFMSLFKWLIFHVTLDMEFVGEDYEFYIDMFKGIWSFWSFLF